MKRSPFIRSLCRNKSGATAVEFAIVSFAFFMLMFGIIEYGLIMLTKVALESAVVQVTRSASIGTVVPGCTDRVCAVRQLVRDKTLGLVKSQSVVVTATVVSTPTTATPPKPDICLDNVSTPYQPAPCTIFIDNNGTPGYQQFGGINATSIGLANDLVEIRVTYLWRVLFPMFEIFQSYSGTRGQKGLLVLTSSAVIKNEPF
jgi:hypothetical protein